MSNRSTDQPVLTKYGNRKVMIYDTMLYTTLIAVCYAEEVDELNKVLYSHDRTPIRLEMDSTIVARVNGYYGTKKGDWRTVVVIIRPDIPVPVIAHECVHIADYIFASIGADTDLSTTNEPYAYLVEYAACCLQDFMERHARLNRKAE